MKRLILICLLSIICTILFTQVPDWLWASRAGGYDNDISYSIAIDNQGNHYITGAYGGTVSFGTTTLISSSVFLDVFIAKLDSNGNWLWAVSAGGASSDRGNSIAVDTCGNLYVTGDFRETANFGTTQLIGNGVTNIFVAKLDTDGNWLWVLQSVGTSPSDFVIRPSLAIDNANHVFVTGYFSGIMSFGNLPPLTNNGNYSLFISKLDSNGNWIWAKQAEGTGFSYSSNVTLEDSINIYLCGYFSGNIVIGITQLTSSGSSDVFAAKLDTNGNWLWAIRAGGTDYEHCSSIALDNSEHIYLTGEFSGTASFGTITLTSSWIGDYDIFIAKLDTSGNIIWAVGAGGVESDCGNSITVDNSDNIYLAGSFSNTAVFGSTSLTSSGVSDVLVAKLDSSGNWLWAEKAGGTASERVHDIALDSSGNLSITGYFNSSTGLGPDSLIVNGTGRIFVAKLHIGEVGVEDDIVPNNSVFPLLSNAHPNPFHRGETAQIKVEIPAREIGTLSFYNLKGQCIKTYSLRSGSHQISFDSKKLASGIYLYQLHTPSAIITKKLVLY